MSQSPKVAPRAIRHSDTGDDASKADLCSKWIDSRAIAIGKWRRSAKRQAPNESVLTAQIIQASSYSSVFEQVGVHAAQHVIEVALHFLVAVAGQRPQAVDVQNADPAALGFHDRADL